MAKGIQGVFDNRQAINQQKLIYGIFKFYNLGLKEFIEASDVYNESFKTYA